MATTRPMQVRMVGAVMVITAPSGYIVGTLVPEYEAFARQLESVTQTPVDVLINLEAVEHLNSTALGWLISLHTSCLRAGKRMKLCSIDKRIENIFAITKLSLVFDVYPTEATALASYAPEPRPS